MSAENTSQAAAAAAATNGEETVPVQQQEQEQEQVKANGEADGVEGVVSAEGEGEVEGEGEGGSVEQNMIELKPVIVHLPHPTYPQTLPRTHTHTHTHSEPNSKSSQTQPTPSSFILHPQPGETIQDIRATLADWVGGYWLGPFSLRIPASSGASSKETEKEKEGETGRGRLLRKGKEGVEIREGEKLSEWLEVGEVFGHVEEGEKGEGEEEEGKAVRELVVQREPYSEADARQAVLRLREYTLPPQESTPLFPSIGVNGGATIFEGIVSGSVAEVDVTAGAGEKDKQTLSSASNGNVKKGENKVGKKPPVVVKTDGQGDDQLFSDWKGLPKTDISKAPLTLPSPAHPAVLRSLIYSPFNPPPPHLKQKGHLLYVNVVTLEGESLMLVCTVRGWYVAKSTAPTLSFDPSPRTSPKTVEAHSLMDLLHGVSPQFTSTLRAIQGGNQETAREPIATIPIPQYPPAYPWLGTAPTNSSISPDFLKTQLAFGYTGAISTDALEGARDWNEELQNARELPRSTHQEKLLRERVLQKTHAEFTAAAVRGSMAIARGDLPPLNPHDDAKTHMFLANNIFYTKGVNSVDAYTHLGGDEAARISHAKDAQGVRLLNKMDVENVYLLGHAVIDWAGERWVCQSVLPGIFSRRKEDGDEVEGEAVEGEKEGDVKGKEGEVKEEKEWVNVNGHSRESSKSEVPAASEEAAPADAENYLIIYGADSEGGISKLHWDAGMHKVMEKVAGLHHLALHKMQDSQGQSYDYWTSVDVKGLRGSDGRRYLLDLPRLLPVDIEWLEKDLEGKILIPRDFENREVGETEEMYGSEAAPTYPHRVALLRPELIHAVKQRKLKDWISEQTEIIGKQRKEQEEAEAAKKAEGQAEGEAKEGEAEKPKSLTSVLKIDDFRNSPLDLRFNADAFVDQPIKAGTEGTAMTYQPSTQTDESDPAIKSVRDASKYLRDTAIAQLLVGTMVSESSLMRDGISLTTSMHEAGINMRYLGLMLAELDHRLAPNVSGRRPYVAQILMTLIKTEMVFRASKHIIRRLVHGLTSEHSACAVSHFLNCLLGAEKNANPTPVYEAFLFNNDPAPLYTHLTPESLRKEILNEIAMRFRYQLGEEFLTKELRKPQILRELATRIAFQLDQREYDFEASAGEETVAEPAETSGKSKKGKKAKVSRDTSRSTSFEPADILTLLPVIKSTAPPATIAEEIFTAGQQQINRDIAMGMELMLEGINMYETTLQVVHPEVAAAYHQYASIIRQVVGIRVRDLAEDSEADPLAGIDIVTTVKLARQAVMVAERTLGLHHPTTLEYYIGLSVLEGMTNDLDVMLRLHKHIFHLWSIIYGGDDVPHWGAIDAMFTVAAFLQNKKRNTDAITILHQIHDMTAGPGMGSVASQKYAGQAMNMLTTAHFGNNDFQAAADCAKQAKEIFESTAGPDHQSTKEAASNLEILTTILTRRSNQQEANRKQLEMIKQRAKQIASAVPNGRVAAPVSSGSASTSAAKEGEAAPAATNGEGAAQEDVDVDALVRFIQGQAKQQISANKNRGKNALRGKKRTGAKR